MWPDIVVAFFVQFRYEIPRRSIVDIQAEVAWLSVILDEPEIEVGLSGLRQDHVAWGQIPVVLLIGFEAGRTVVTCVGGEAPGSGPIIVPLIEADLEAVGEYGLRRNHRDCWLLGDEGADVDAI